MPAMGLPAGLSPVSSWSTPPTSTPSCTSPGRCGSRGPSRGRCYRSLRCGLLRPLLHAQGAALPEPYRSCAAGDAPDVLQMDEAYIDSYGTQSSLLDLETVSDRKSVV